MTMHLPRWAKALAFFALWPCLPASSVGGLGVQRMVAVERPSSLRSRYGLSVVAVPEPPADGIRPHQTTGGCPVELRAIVVSEPPEKSFVVVSFSDRSTVLFEGQGTRTPRGWVAVGEVHDDHAVLRAGGETYRCGIGERAIESTTR